jgi:ketosteroid isomerase-like protein
MRKANPIVLALVATSLLAAPLALGQGGYGTKGGKAEEEIKTLSDQLAQAYLKGDTSFFEKYLADDYTAIYASGQPYTKAESLKPGAVKYESFDVREIKIRVYGHTAVVTSLTSAKGTIQREGKPFSGDYRRLAFG